MTEAAPESPQTPRWQALAMLLAGAAVIGFAPILVRLTQTGPAAAGFWRLLLALPALWVLTAMDRTPRAGAFSNLALVAGLMFALDLGTWHYGIRLTSVADATVLPNLTPVIVTGIAWFVFRERPARLFLAAVALAVIGASAMSLARGTGPRGANPPLGDLLSVITAFWYAFYFLAVGRARQVMGPARVMFWSSLTGAPWLLLAALAMRESILPAALAGWAACLGLAAMHVAGQGSIAWALGRLPTATASVVVLVQPVVAAILGYVLFRETLSLWQAIGGAVALSGVVLAQWASARSARMAAREVAPARAVSIISDNVP